MLSPLCWCQITLRSLRFSSSLACLLLEELRKGRFASAARDKVDGSGRGGGHAEPIRAQGGRIDHFVAIDVDGEDAAQEKWRKIPESWRERSGRRVSTEHAKEEEAKPKQIREVVSLSSDYCDSAIPAEVYTTTSGSLCMATKGEDAETTTKKPARPGLCTRLHACVHGGLAVHVDGESHHRGRCEPACVHVINLTCGHESPPTWPRPSPPAPTSSPAGCLAATPACSLYIKAPSLSQPTISHNSINKSKSHSSHIEKSTPSTSSHFSRPFPMATTVMASAASSLAFATTTAGHLLPARLPRTVHTHKIGDERPGRSNGLYVGLFIQSKDWTHWTQPKQQHTTHATRKLITMRTNARSSPSRCSLRDFSLTAPPLHAASHLRMKTWPSLQPHDLLAPAFTRSPSSSESQVVPIFTPDSNYPTHQTLDQTTQRRAPTGRTRLGHDTHATRATQTRHDHEQHNLKHAMHEHDVVYFLTPSAMLGQRRRSPLIVRAQKADDDAETTKPAAEAKKPAGLWDALAFSGPAPERINGRLAMVGFVSALAVEASRGDGLLAQAGNGAGLTWSAYTAVVLSAASLAPLLQGETVEGRSGGLFNLFTADAEIWNGRLAMLGLVALAATEYLTGAPLINA
ncbi:hypothetical protein HU200_016099 [Digitaria exilis]|uniref:Early light-induced protein n=1 Tax=Digitaria exilis TaxID=1010633 RepID=A0A835KKD1_9POAL|nr:hypothetical protein HU200_016099 [Digitaria exilis]